jgi:hypothetical protein
MTSNNAKWERWWFYLHNDGAGPPYADKVLLAKTDAWHHGVSPASRQERLESLTNTLWSLADAGLGAASILANLHHRRIMPLMERELRIFEMSDAVNPTSLACSRLLQGRLLPEYATTRARRAVNLKSMPHSHDDLWSFVMLPDALVVSGLLPRFKFSRHVDVTTDSFRQQRATVQAAQSNPPRPRARSSARTAQRWKQERAAREKERRLQRRE